MAAPDYPNSIPVFPTINPDAPLSTPETLNHPEYHEKEVAEIQAISTELGLNPKGTKASVKARLDDLESNINHINLTTITSSPYTVISSDRLIIINSATAVTINLPLASGSGRILIIKNIGVGIVTADGNTTDTIDGELTQELIQYEAIQLIDSGNNQWSVV